MIRLARTLALGAMALATVAATGATASAQEAYIGEIRSFPYNFCPRGWTEAKGQLMPISQYQALFSLLGTTYGGDGRTTFALPNLAPLATSVPASAPAGGEVRIYQHCNYEGWSQSVGLGDYAAGGFGSNESFVDNAASSNRVSEGWQVTLYDGAAQNGASITLSGDDACLVDNGFNDALSSVRVTRVEAPAASGPGERQCIALNGIFPSRN